MAVKYKRDPDRTFDWNVKGRNPQATRRKTLYIYAGLGVAFVAAFAYHMMGQGISAGWFGPLEAQAVIVEKFSQFEGDPAARYFVRCEVDLSGLEYPEGYIVKEIPGQLTALVRTDEASWRGVEVGTMVHVIYHISPEFDEVRVQRLGLDTLMVDSVE